MECPSRGRKSSKEESHEHQAHIKIQINTVTSIIKEDCSKTNKGDRIE